MARDEEDREDLLREAVALIERVELRVEGEALPVVAGFRRDGSASFFFGVDPVYQFNSTGQLRRGFRNGLLIKAEQGHLVSLTRRRTATEVQLVRHELTAEESGEFLDSAAERLATLRESIAAGQYKIVGQVPPDADVVGRVCEWLGGLAIPIVIAISPRVG